MKKLFALEVAASNIQGIIEGDEVIVDSNETPRGNGKDLAVFYSDDTYFISRFTHFGNQILLLPDEGPISIIRTENVEIIGKVVGGSADLDIIKAPALTGAENGISLHA